jgi:hypothetical protein
MLVRDSDCWCLELSLTLSSELDRYNCPPGYNPSDFYLKLVSQMPGAEVEGEQARMEKLVKAFKSSELCLQKPIKADDE